VSDQQAPQTAHGDTDEQAAPAKKKYERPTLTQEPVFETTALACGKISGTQGQCRFNRKAS
jgi:hypothetical protein